MAKTNLMGTKRYLVSWKYGPLTLTLHPSRGGRGRVHRCAYYTVCCKGSLAIKDCDTKQEALDYIAHIQAVGNMFAPLTR